MALARVVWAIVVVLGIVGIGVVQGSEEEGPGVLHGKVVVDVGDPWESCYVLVPVAAHRDIALVTHVTRDDGELVRAVSLWTAVALRAADLHPGANNNITMIVNEARHDTASLVSFNKTVANVASQWFLLVGTEYEHHVTRVADAEGRTFPKWQHFPHFSEVAIPFHYCNGTFNCEKIELDDDPNYTPPNDTATSTVRRRLNEHTTKESVSYAAFSHATMVLGKELPVHELVGEVMHLPSVTSEPQSVSFGHPFRQPVVFAGPLTFHDKRPAHTRITEVFAKGVKLAAQSPQLRVKHADESTTLTVLEEGSWTLSDGTRVEVGRVSVALDTLHDFRTESVEFLHPFSLDARVVVLAQVQGSHGDEFVDARLANVPTPTGFTVTVDARYTDRKALKYEVYDVGYIAFEQGLHRLDRGLELVAGATERVVTSDWHYERLNPCLCEGVLGVLANLETLSGKEGAHVRILSESQDRCSVMLRVQGEENLEGSIHPFALSHDKAEVVAYVAVSGEGAFTGIRLRDFRPVGEMSHATYVDDNGETVWLYAPYTTPPVVFAGPLSDNGEGRTVARILSVTRENFTVAAEELAGCTAVPHAHESLAFMAFPEGQFVLPSGQLLVAGTYEVRLDALSQNHNVEFKVPFQTENVAVFAQLQTRTMINGFAHVQLTATPSSHGFSFHVEIRGAKPETAPDGTPADVAAERVGYIAIEQGVDEVDDSRIVVGRTEAFASGNYARVRMVECLPTRPAGLLAHLASRNDPAAAHLRQPLGNDDLCTFSVRVENDEPQTV